LGQREKEREKFGTERRWVKTKKLEGEEKKRERVLSPEFKK